MKKNQTIRDLTIESLYQQVYDYCSWYIERGLYLPPDFSTKPHEWNEVLNQIKKAFQLLHDKKKFTETEESDIKGGLALFGKYLFYLTDKITDR